MMNIVVFIESSRQLIGWARCDVTKSRLTGGRLSVVLNEVDRVAFYRKMAIKLVYRKMAKDGECDHKSRQKRKTMSYGTSIVTYFHDI